MVTQNKMKLFTVCLILWHALHAVCCSSSFIQRSVLNTQHKASAPTTAHSQHTERRSEEEEAATEAFLTSATDDMGISHATLPLDALHAPLGFSTKGHHALVHIWARGAPGQLHR